MDLRETKKKLKKKLNRSGKHYIQSLKTKDETMQAQQCPRNPFKLSLDAQVSQNGHCTPLKIFS
jgi:transcription initiation factor IIE alpha subunit